MHAHTFTTYLCMHTHLHIYMLSTYIYMCLKLCMYTCIYVYVYTENIQEYAVGQEEQPQDIRAARFEALACLRRQKSLRGSSVRIPISATLAQLQVVDSCKGPCPGSSDFLVVVVLARISSMELASLAKRDAKA